MKQGKINKFNKTQIFQLYAYLVAYENSGIEQYESTKTMLNEHPELSDLKKVVESVKCHKANAQEMKKLDFKSLTNEIYQTKNKQNNILSFLAHLRNSIAHGCAIGFDGKVLITDFGNPRYNPIDFTARGCVEFAIINQITSILNKIEL